MASKRLRNRAQRIAQAQARPARQAQHQQISATRRDTQQTVQSLGSENRGVQNAIGAARHDFKSIPGLKGRDQRIALEQLAQMRGQTAAGIAFQKSDARLAGQSVISDLRQTMPQPDVASAITDLLAQRTANRHDVQMAKLGSKLDLRSALAQNRQTARLDRRAPTTPLTPNEQRGIKTNRENALALVRAAYAESVKGTKHAPAIPTSQSEWQQWGDQLYGLYHTQVDRGDLNWAIKRFKRQPDAGGNIVAAVLKAVKG